MLACGSPDACTGAVATELKRHLPQNQEEDKGPLEGARFSRLRAGVVSSGSSRLPGVYQALKSVVQPLLDLIVQSPEEGAEAIFSRPGLGYWSCRYLVCFWDGELFLIRLSLGHAAVSLSAENHRCPNHGAAGHLGARQALRVLLAGPLVMRSRPFLCLGGSFEAVLLLWRTVVLRHLWTQRCPAANEFLAMLADGWSGFGLTLNLSVRGAGASTPTSAGSSHSVQASQGLLLCS